MNGQCNYNNCQRRALRDLSMHTSAFDGPTDASSGRLAPQDGGSVSRDSAVMRRPKAVSNGAEWGSLTTRGMFFLLATAALFAACEPRHIRAYTPRERMYDPKEYEEVKMANPEMTGSIWSESSPSLFEDLRASRIGDILTVVIDEKQSGSGDASTSLNDESSMDAGMSQLFGLMAALVQAYPDIESEQLIGLMSSSDFSGDGTTSRTSQLEGRIAVRVKKVLPNGDLFVEGHKVILINSEELHFYVSGAIRQSDVRPDNSVSSSLIADAQVEFSGRGVISDKQSPGWLQQLADKYSPI